MYEFMLVWGSCYLLVANLDLLPSWLVSIDEHRVVEGLRSAIPLSLRDLTLARYGLLSDHIHLTVVFILMLAYVRLQNLHI